MLSLENVVYEIIKNFKYVCFIHLSSNNSDILYI